MVRSLVLLSGGLDSSTCLALAKKESSEVSAVSFLYGQKHVIELQHAREIAKYYQVPHHLIEVPNVFRGAGSTLIDKDRPNPRLSYAELQEAEGPSPTYVPYRNGTLLSIASSLAMAQNCEYLWFGAHADDAHNWAYPDCTPEFIGAQAAAIYIGSYTKLRLRSPIMWMTKAEVVKLGHSLKVPFELTYSCYEGGNEHCGLCPTCISRKVAFSQAGISDTTRYVA